MKLLLFCVLIFAGTAVADSRTLVTKRYTDLSVTPGGVVMRFNKTGIMKNIYGGNDIFGRKSNTGFLELRYYGISPKGNPLFATLDSEKPPERLVNPYALSVSITETSNSTGPMFEHNLKEGDLEFEGYPLVILKATPSQLKYRVEEFEE